MTLFVVSGAFLAGLVAAGVPLALHLLNRRPKEEIPFPGLLFLLQSETKARSGGSWRRRLILLCRVLAVAALCLAFCQPFLSSVGVAPGRTTVLLWDDSFSMQLPPAMPGSKRGSRRRCAKPLRPRPPRSESCAAAGFCGTGLSPATRRSCSAFSARTRRTRAPPTSPKWRARATSGCGNCRRKSGGCSSSPTAQELPWRRTPREEAFENATEFCVIRPEPATVHNATVTGAELSTAPGLADGARDGPQLLGRTAARHALPRLAGTRRASLPVDLSRARKPPSC